MNEKSQAAVEEEGEIDYQLLGALIGSAWREKQLKPRGVYCCLACASRYKEGL